MFDLFGTIEDQWRKAVRASGERDFPWLGERVVWMFVAAAVVACRLLNVPPTRTKP